MDTEENTKLIDELTFWDCLVLADEGFRLKLHLGKAKSQGMRSECQSKEVAGSDFIDGETK